jgi:hypothetical protein
VAITLVTHAKALAARTVQPFQLLHGSHWNHSDNIRRPIDASKTTDIRSTMKLQDSFFALSFTAYTPSLLGLYSVDPTVVKISELPTSEFPDDERILPERLFRTQSETLTSRTYAHFSTMS